MTDSLSLFEPMMLLILFLPFGIACFAAGYALGCPRRETEDDHECIKGSPL